LYKKINKLLEVSVAFILDSEFWLLTSFLKTDIVEEPDL
jgi:hypothetical protein